MDKSLLIPIGIAIFAVWFVYILNQYIDSFSHSSRQDKERKLFGRVLRPTTRLMIYKLNGTSPKKMIVFLSLIAAIVLIAIYFRANI